MASKDKALFMPLLFSRRPAGLENAIGLSLAPDILQVAL